METAGPRRSSRLNQTVPGYRSSRSHQSTILTDSRATQKTTRQSNHARNQEQPPPQIRGTVRPKRGEDRRVRKRPARIQYPSFHRRQSVQTYPPPRKKQGKSTRQGRRHRNRRNHSVRRKYRPSTRTSNQRVRRSKGPHENRGRQHMGLKGYGNCQEGRSNLPENGVPIIKTRPKANGGRSNP